MERVMIIVIAVAYVLRKKKRKEKNVKSKWNWMTSVKAQQKKQRDILKGWDYVRCWGPEGSSSCYSMSMTK
jgi:hypothetical protein